MNLMLVAQIFRFAGDALMVGSRVTVIKKIKETKSVSGLSLQTQLIYFVAYVFRYFDLVLTPFRLEWLYIYNSIMKVLFVSYQVYIIYLILCPLRTTYTRRFDSFNLPILFGAAFLLGPFVKGETFSFGSWMDDYFYTVSLLLEAVAILPQLLMIQEAGDCEPLVSLYIFTLGLYRLMYIISFLTKYCAGKKLDMLVFITSMIQTGLYVDFFMVYYKHMAAHNKSN